MQSYSVGCARVIHGFCCSNENDRSPSNMRLREWQLVTVAVVVAAGVREEMLEKGMEKGMEKVIVEAVAVVGAAAQAAAA
jgi:hypothetical protein